MTENLAAPDPARDASLMRPVLMRMRNAGPRSPAFDEQVRRLVSKVEVVSARTVLQTEDDRVTRPRYLLSGWACRFRHLSDGRRQIFDVVLPGDGVGVCLRPTPLANTSTITLTACRFADASDLLRNEALLPELTPLLQAQADADERRMLNQIVRLGRQSALERMAHLLLELQERLEVVGDSFGDRFPLFLTQEALADLLGLSVVHVNRTLQELRRQELVVVERGYARLSNVPALRTLADYDPARR